MRPGEGPFPAEDPLEFILQPKGEEDADAHENEKRAEPAGFQKGSHKQQEGGKTCQNGRPFHKLNKEIELMPLLICLHRRPVMDLEERADLLGHGIVIDETAKRAVDEKIADHDGRDHGWPDAGEWFHGLNSERGRKGTATPAMR